MESVDIYLSEIWNKTHTLEPIHEENVWDFCRIFEKKGDLVGDDAAISAVTIGPFKIASVIDVKRKDMLMYFLESVIPALFSKITNLSFDQVYTLYLIPAAKLFFDLADQCYWIKDSLQWKILIFLREKNKYSQYPSIKDIKKSDEFRGVEDWQIDEAVGALSKTKNMLGEKNNLILIDFDGRIKCLV